MITTANRHFTPLIGSRKEWYSVQDVAKILGRSPQWVRDSYESGALRGHRLIGRGGLNARRNVYQIHRESLVLYLLETANYTPEEFVETLARLLDRLDPEEFRSIVRKAEGRQQLVDRKR